MFVPTAEQIQALEYVMEIMRAQIDSQSLTEWDQGFNTGVSDCISVLDNVIRGDFNYDQHLAVMEKL